MRLGRAGRCRWMRWSPRARSSDDIRGSASLALASWATRRTRGRSEVFCACRRHPQRTAASRTHAAPGASRLRLSGHVDSVDIAQLQFLVH
eukprot:9492074-Pyramimonas_sp.AAC.1